MNNQFEALKIKRAVYINKGGCIYKLYSPFILFLMNVHFINNPGFAPEPGYHLLPKGQ
jgi:hypothetical protein